MKPWQIILILFLLGSTLYAVERIQRGKAERRAEAAEQAVDSLGIVIHTERSRADSLAKVKRSDSLVYRDRWYPRWDTLRVPGAVDTLPPTELFAIADSTIRACGKALSSCEATAEAERRIAKLERERADSAEKAAGYWKDVAKGPFIRPAIEFTLTPELDPMAAFDLTLGRARLKVLGRVEAVEPVESCAYVSSQEASVCSTGNPLTYRFGVRYAF